MAPAAVRIARSVPPVRTTVSPVGAAARTASHDVSTPARASSPRMNSPAASGPTAATSATESPSRAAATAVIAADPPRVRIPLRTSFSFCPNSGVTSSPITSTSGFASPTTTRSIPARPLPPARSAEDNLDPLVLQPGPVLGSDPRVRDQHVDLPRGEDPGERGHRAAADPGQHLLAGQLVEVPPDRGRGHAQRLGRVLDLQRPAGGEQLEQLVPPPVAAHRRLLPNRHGPGQHGPGRRVLTRAAPMIPSSRVTSAAIASRPAEMYRRGSATAASAASLARTAAVKTLFSCVATLILVIPAATAAASPSSGTPDEPCSTSGTGTAARSAAIRSRSRAASRVSIACELPTATASASTPVAATYPAAAEGSVRAVGECTPSFPPISPSSASAQRPRSWHHRVTSAVAATFRSYGSDDASNITEPNPAAAASATSPGLVA